MTEHERNKRRAAIVRRHRVWLRDHGLEERRTRKVRDERSDETADQVSFEDPLDVLPDLG